MARSLLFWQKKRGSRWTGSRQLGLVGELVFSAASFTLGFAGLAAVVTGTVVPEWRVNHRYASGVCVVLQRRLSWHDTEDGRRYRPEVQVQQRVGGENYVVWTYDLAALNGEYSLGRDEAQQAIGPFQTGRQYACWYDPDNPRRVVLVRGYRYSSWLILAVPVSFVLIGSGGLLHAAWNWGKSVERRAAMKRGAPLEILTPGQRGGEHPNVPPSANLTDSPGTALAYRLPAASSPVWMLGVSLVFSAIWNGIVAIFAYQAFVGHLEGRADWFLTLFVVPFAVVGVGSVVYFLRQLLVATGIGPTLVEISHHPLFPGKSCRLFVSQSGRLRMKRLAVSLVCEEKATFRQGTDTRTETRRVYQQPLFAQDEFDIHRGIPFEADCELALPDAAMHSFKSEHNEVNWKIVVQGEVAGWPDYERSFPVVVYPSGNGIP